MKRYLLLILLTSWSLLIPIAALCDVGKAVPNHMLSIQRSLLSNADVAFLKEYNATDLEECMKECCSGKYGSCTLVSFKKDTNNANCLHFNCRPLNKCKFLSSNTTDSFTFSSYDATLSSVPSTITSSDAKNLTTVFTSTNISYSLQHGETQQFKNNNKASLDKVDSHKLASSKLYKDLNDALLAKNSTKSSIKPRKGVSMEVPYPGFLAPNQTKSKVKPRKGVGPGPNMTTSFVPFMMTPTLLSNSATIEPSKIENNMDTSSSNWTNDVNDTSSEFLSDLEKVFQDDTHVESSKSLIHFEFTTKAHPVKVSPPVLDTSTLSWSNTNQYSITPIKKNDINSLKSSLGWKIDQVSQHSTPSFDTSTTNIANELPVISSQVVEISEANLNKLGTISDKNEVNLLNQIAEQSRTQEMENQRRYKSSMRLVLSLVFGLFVLFGVLAVIAKRIYDGWLRRHYRRMDFLIDGMYNGYG